MTTRIALTLSWRPMRLAVVFVLAGAICPRRGYRGRDHARHAGTNVDEAIADSRATALDPRTRGFSTRSHGAQV
jgi:hypothetical protein